MADPTLSGFEIRLWSEGWGFESRCLQGFFFKCVWTYFHLSWSIIFSMREIIFLQIICFNIKFSALNIVNQILFYHALIEILLPWSPHWSHKKTLNIKVWIFFPFVGTLKFLTRIFFRWSQSFPSKIQISSTFFYRKNGAFSGEANGSLCQ